MPSYKLEMIRATWWNAQAEPPVAAHAFVYVAAQFQLLLLGLLLEFALKRRVVGAAGEGFFKGPTFV